jgi:uncharacterized protein
MRIVLAGASGLIGQALRSALQQRGDDVLVLVRRAPSGADEARWDPERHELDPAVLSDADAVVALSGAGVGDHRWTPAYKRTLLTSRLDSVGTIARAVADSDGPRVLVSASAVGYYGDTGDRPIDDTAPPGNGFLADLCTQWEAATAPADTADIRVAKLRTGLVLSSAGGLLKRLKPIVQLGVAGRLGSGRQYMPWISLADEVAAIQHVLDHDLHGSVNLTGPAPVRNADFMSALGELLHRPTVLPTPAFALRVVLGEFAEDTLTGQRALPAKLQQSDFAFQHADIKSALRWALEH